MNGWFFLTLVTTLLLAGTVTPQDGGQMASQTFRRISSNRNTVTNQRLVERKHKMGHEDYRTDPRNEDLVWTRHSDFGIYESCDVRFVLLFLAWLLKHMRDGVVFVTLTFG